MRSPAAQAKFRREVFHAHKQHDETGRIFLVCYKCGCRIDPACEFWDAEHVIADYFGGTEGKPICKPCHKIKTATQDVPAIAKSKSKSDKFYGIRKSSWPKRPMRRERE